VLGSTQDLGHPGFLETGVAEAPHLHLPPNTAQSTERRHVRRGLATLM
jgi:hypothetical protein